MAYTIRKIAAEAGVSASTVSRALSRPDMVSPETRERVLKTAQQYGYENTRVPAQATLNTIGVILPDLCNQFFAEIAQALHRRAWANGTALMLGATNEDLLLEQSLATHYTGACDALVMIAPRLDDAQILDIFEAGKPLVLVNREVGGIPSVLVQVETGARQAVTHLAALGHQRIGFVAGPISSRMSSVMAKAVADEAESLGIESVLVAHTEPDQVGGIAVADLVVASKVTAVIAHNDLIAAGLLMKLHDRNISVPAQISVVGCDDTDISKITTPRLTTISMDRDAIAWAAIDLLTQGLSPIGVKEVLVPTRLVVRSSTALIDK